MVDIQTHSPDGHLVSAEGISPGIERYGTEAHLIDSDLAVED